MRNVIICAAVIVGAGVLSCNLLLPDEFAINAPIAHMLFGRGVDAPADEVVQSRLRVPPGLSIGVWAEEIRDARFMRFTPAGDLVVSQPRESRLMLVEADRDGDGRSDGQRVLIGDLDQPHGFDFRKGALYIGEGSAITRVAFREDGPGTGRTEGEPERIVEGIPSGGNHWSRTLRFGPDGGMYLSVGSSCNVCEEEDPRRAALLRFEPDGSGAEIYASGLRNSVGFDWRPATGELFATDNGRDLLGDDYPPCELNRIVRGGFYGWPYANGDKRSDPDFGAGNEERIANSISPAHPFRAHNAPLGITFVRHPTALPGFAGSALVALHGSWNRHEKDGYKVVSLHWDARGAIEERDFVTGFNVDDDVIGRPVDVAEGPNGAIYVSDDYAGVIYRVAPAGTSRSSQAGRAQTGPESNEPSDPFAGIAPDELDRLRMRGDLLFAASACGTCHLPDEALPGIVVRPLRDLERRYDVESLTRFFATPQPPMPVVDLPESERRALAVSVLSRFGRP